MSADDESKGLICECKCEGECVFLRAYNEAQELYELYEDDEEFCAENDYEPDNLIEQINDTYCALIKHIQDDKSKN